MARCRQCNLLISGAAEHCPRCGSPLPARFHFSALGVVIVGILIVVSFAALRNGGWTKVDADKVTAPPELKPDQFKKDDAKKLHAPKFDANQVAAMLNNAATAVRQRSSPIDPYAGAMA